MKKTIYNKTSLFVAKDYKELSWFAADLIINRIRQKPEINMLLPAGFTPHGTYSILRKVHASFFKKTKFFNMDEYCNRNGKHISSKNPVSFRYYMKENLFGSIKPTKSFFPGAENAKHEGSYDQQIKKLSGIDLCLNALGRDGHTFGFNFPGVSFDSRTRIVKINEGTRRVNKAKTGIETPEYALTTGIRTGMESKEIIFLVSGREKADILRRIIYAAKPTTKIPATVLKMHPRCVWVADEDAASGL